MNRLKQFGFVRLGAFTLEKNSLRWTTTHSPLTAVYAFTVGNEVCYIGEATRPSRCMAAYARGRVKQNGRIAQHLRQALKDAREVQVWALDPPLHSFNGVEIEFDRGP